MSKPIDRFRGEYRWLSNFAPAEVKFAGGVYPSTEHAYQASKSPHFAERERIRLLPTPGQAKRAGRGVTMREDWNDVREAVMLEVTRCKYALPEYRKLLLDTADREIIEGNTWGDRFWGKCRGTGLNKFGIILMQVRAELRS